MNRDTEPLTPVLFRKSRAPSKYGPDVTAVLPAEPATLTGDMTCYCHVGQHGACSLAWYNTTRAATPTEYEALKAELESAPYAYRLKVYRRMTPGHRAQLRAEVQRLNALR